MKLYRANGTQWTQPANHLWQLNLLFFNISTYLRETHLKQCGMMCSVHFEHMWPSKCMDLRPGLVIFLLLFCFFAFFGWQSCSTDSVRLDRSIERHINYGGRAEEHSQIKYSQHAPHHMQISLPLFSYTSSPFFFFFQRTH